MQSWEVPYNVEVLTLCHSMHKKPYQYSTLLSHPCWIFLIKVSTLGDFVKVLSAPLAAVNHSPIQSTLK